ncbi:carboxypeptidase regulatory-like domain-containing protein [Dactylosporangium sp. NPDC051541]|uniref:carboxypeptidase regulatory-like domain-containing protein n=1 Tax=Dactylosporangium sp. NPDC051541 TaxID=3363977 RepID=UPI003791799F
MRQHAPRRPLLLAALTVMIAAVALVPAGPTLAAAGTGTISGHLTDAAGLPAAGAFVWAQTRDMSATASATTDAAGSYTMTGVTAADYVMSFRASPGGFTQWAHQKTGFGEADTVTVGAGAAVVVNEQLLPTGVITGSLLNRDGTPSTGTVTAYTMPGQAYVDSKGVSGGAFRIELPVGAYKLQFRVRDAFYQWNGGAKSFETASAIQVVAGQTVQLQETVLPTGSIAGRLTNADGSPAAGTNLAVIQDSRSFYGNATTDADGRYRVDNLLLDDYTVGFYGSTGVQQFAHRTLDPNAAARIPVRDGQVTTVDEVFLPKGKIRVVAHDATTGAALSGFCASYTILTWVGGCTDGTEVVLNDVFVGAYNLEVQIDDRRHFSVPSVPVTVAAGQTAGIDVGLRLGAAVNATMVKRSGGAATDGCVQAARVGGAFSSSPYGYCSDWQANPVTGKALLGPLEPGTYQVFAQPRDPALGLQWVGAAGGTGDRDAAAQFTVAAGDVLNLPVVRFDPGGTIQGKVTDVAGGAPLPYSCVWVAALPSTFNGSGDCPAFTDADGVYTIKGVGPYQWPVEYARGDREWRWSGNTVDRQYATKVQVTAGQTVRADAKMAANGGKLTGTIRTAGGQPADAMVTAYSAATGEPVQFFGGLYSPDPQPPATFTIPNVAPQRVRLHWSTADGRSGWVGGADFAHAQVFQVRRDLTLTVTITLP